MKQVKLFCSFVFLLTMLVGCSVTPIQKEVNMPSNKGVALQSVNIRNFKGGTKAQGNEMSRLIIGELNRQGHVVVTKDKPEGIMTGEMDIGPLRTSEWIDQWECKDKDDQVKTCTSYKYKAEKSLSASYELQLKNELVADTFSEPFKQESSGDSYGEAKAKVPAEKDIDSLLMSRVANKIAADISPHKENRTFNYKNGSDSNIKIGIIYVKNGRYDQAESIFRQVIEQTPKIENRAAATYNLGLLHEMQDDFKQAFEYYRIANQLVLGQEDYIEALTRAETRYKQDKEYKNQTWNKKKR